MSTRIVITLAASLLAIAPSQAAHAAEIAGKHLSPKVSINPGSRSEGATKPSAARCNEPFPRALTARGFAASSDQLRTLAAGCEQAAHARLFYNRAYHAEVVDDLGLLAGLHKGYASNDRRRLESTRVFVGLSEAFAEHAWRSRVPTARRRAISDLNRAYEMAIQDVELTLRGFDLLVGHPISAR